MLKTRASSTQRIAMCPGSERASYGCPDRDNDDSTRGTRIHDYIAKSYLGETLPDLIQEEIDTALELKAMFDSFIEANVQGEYKIFIEEYYESHGWSGHLDIAIVPYDENQDIIINDWKSGWGDVPNPDVNGQVRVYVCLIAEAYPHRNIQGTLTTPRGVAKPVRYTPEAIRDSWLELGEIREAAFSPSAERFPSTESCKYCKAFNQPTCPETCKFITEIPERLPALNEYSDYDLGKLGILGKMASKQIKLVEEEIRSRLEKGETVPGCFLKAGTIAKSIGNTKLAFDILTEIPDYKFLEVCTVSVKKLGDLLAETNDTTKVAGKQEVLDRCASIIKETPRKGSLKIG